MMNFLSILPVYTVVVQPFEDGTFRYLSNSIEQIELELPPIAKSQQR